MPAGTSTYILMILRHFLSFTVRKINSSYSLHACCTLLLNPCHIIRTVSTIIICLSNFSAVFFLTLDIKLWFISNTMYIEIVKKKKEKWVLSWIQSLQYSASVSNISYPSSWLHLLKSKAASWQWMMPSRKVLPYRNCRKKGRELKNINRTGALPQRPYRHKQLYRWLLIAYIGAIFWWQKKVKC